MTTVGSGCVAPIVTLTREYSQGGPAALFVSTWHEANSVASTTVSTHWQGVDYRLSVLQWLLLIMERRKLRLEEPPFRVERRNVWLQPHLGRSISTEYSTYSTLTLRARHLLFLPSIHQRNWTWCNTWRVRFRTAEVRFPSVCLLACK